MDKNELKALSDEALAEYLRDCVATLKILNDLGSRKLPQVHEHYLQDISSLYELGRLTEDEYNELKDDAIMRFQA